MSHQTYVADSRPKRVWGLFVASALCWLWGILVVLLYAPTLLAAIRAGNSRSYLVSHAVVAALLACVYSFAGYGLARRSIVAAIAAILLSGLFALLMFPLPSSDVVAVLVRLGIIAVNLAIIGLVAVNWRHLGKRAAARVGA